MQGRESRFAACHPAVTFTFFVAAILGSVCFQHPAYLAVSVFSAVALLLTERGRKGAAMAAGMLPLFLLISAINPLFNTQGEHVLFTLLGRPYTWEALVYGMVVAGMLVAALCWFSCYSVVMTSDKFTCLFGSLAPALSLILVMILRLIPAYQRKASQISGARRCVGKSMASTGDWKEKAKNGMTVLSSLTSWALEGAIITADSMRSRGYGTARRSSFQIYTWQRGDALLLGAMTALGIVTLVGASLGWTQAAFTPAWNVTAVTGSRIWGLGAYGGLMLLPAIVNTWETIKWKFFRSRI